MAAPELGASLDLFDIEKPVVVLRLSRGAAQALAQGDVSTWTRDQLLSAESQIRSNQQHRAGGLMREARELTEMAQRLRSAR